MDRIPDLDPQETREWLDALEGVLRAEGPDRAHFLIEQLIDKARREGAFMPFSANTAYINTIPVDKQVRIPGDQNIGTMLQANKLDATLLGVSRGLQTLRRQVLDLAALPVNVLIRGETGSGKELVARCLHDFGPRADKPFVALNCAAIPEQLFEAELFGHESGAFTGATGKRIGKLEYADGGTLFLDEIESMPLAQQVKLLRVLQEQKLERLGSNQSIRVDLRIIAATKPDLLDEARAGRFREDLAYRLNVAELRLPPLRDRREDIPLLFESFAQQAAERLGRTFPPLTGPQLSHLLSHDWPGNVRELANVAERQVLGLGEPEPAGIDPGQSLAAQQEAFEAHCLRAALTRHKGDVKAVLEELQLPRRTFNEKMQRHGLTREMFLTDS